MSASMVTVRAVVQLDDPSAGDPMVAGHKAATLARLTGLGLPVPRGVVLTSGACDRIVQAAGRVGEAGPAALTATSIPSDIWQDLVAASEQLTGGWVRAVAVRSSGISEDLPGASFAGQYETVLDVKGPEQLADAVRRCLGSAFSARVVAYAHRMDGHAPMAVLVQEMVPADAAGVAFTANPVTGDRETLVSAVRGLGDRLVGGEASPDEWVVRDGGVERVAAPEDAIDAATAGRVADLAARVETALGSPQDIEWAAAGGELYLLQARPITALPRRPQIRPPERGSWMKDTAHYPMPLTPFGASIYLPAMDAGMTPMGEEWGLLFERVEQRSLGGEVYLRMVPVGGKDGKPGTAPPWWVIWIASRMVPALRKRARAADAAMRSGLADRLLDRWYGEWREAFRTEAAALRARSLAPMSDEALLAHLDDLVDFLLRGEEVHFRLFMPYCLRTYELGTICERLLGWSPLDAMTLLAGTSQASSAPGRALETLAASIGGNPAARAVLEGDEESFIPRLRDVDPDIAAAAEAYLEEHGHRTLSYDPAQPTLFERPDLLAGLLRDRLAQAEKPTRPDEAARAIAVARARELLAGHRQADRDEFDGALAAAERAYPVREDNIAYVDNAPAGLVRYAMLEFGRRLVARGVLGNPEDAAYLTVDELRSALRNGSEDLRDLVATRRGERAWVAAHPGPASYGPDAGPPPDLRGLPPSLRQVMSAIMWSMGVMLEVPATAGVDGQIVGAPGSPGRRTGPVRVIRDESEFGRLRPGDVLVCPITTPSWSVLFSQAGALVTDGGGVLAHAAVIAREYGIPAVLATQDGSRRLRDGQMVTVDGSAGTVTPI